MRMNILFETLKIKPTFFKCRSTNKLLHYCDKLHSLNYSISLHTFLHVANNF